MTWWPVALLLVALAASLLAGLLRSSRAGTAAASLPVATVGIALLTAAGAAAQAAFPSLLGLMERDSVRIAAGEIWRVGTALLVQDGGLPGTVFNLGCLVAVGTIAERLWGPAKWLLLYFGCGIAAELIALAWQPVGAGNSIAVMALAGSLCALGASGGGRALLPALAGLSCGLALAAMRDIHGGALLLGALAGGLLSLSGRRAANPGASSL